MIDIPALDCVGCGACVQACPTHCIEMKPDAEGFLYPVILSKENCISCGRCELACPSLHAKDKRLQDTLSFGCKLKKQEEIYNSTSGGAFFAIAEWFIEQGGIVWGAAYDNYLHVTHQAAETIEELSKLRKSKYVQSEIGRAYCNVKTALRKGRSVLFSGTSCQIAGLKQFLGSENEKLFTVQVFCAQVISPLAWEKYIQWIEAKYHGKVKHFDFRYKQPVDTENVFSMGNPIAGWKQACVFFELDDGRSYVIPWASSCIANAYMEALMLRPSCTACKFKMKNSIPSADLVIGDFWGCENTAPECFDSRGVSAVILSSEKGKNIFEKVQDKLESIPVATEMILKGNPGACGSTNPHSGRASFFEELCQSTTDFQQLVGKHLGRLSAYPGKQLKIGLLGSFNTRAAIVTLCASSNSGLTYQYSNSSLISLMSPPIAVPTTLSLPRNPFRSDMLQADFQKTLVQDCVEELVDVDYFVLDFLEERFNLVVTKFSYITLSDALADTDFQPNFIIDRIDTQISALWEESCLRFISWIKKHFEPKQILLVEAFLSEGFYTEGHEWKSFDDLERIQAINKQLAQYYEFFKSHYPVKHAISIADKSNLYCDRNHKHGCLPCHANKEYSNAMADELLRAICEREE